MHKSMCVVAAGLVSALCVDAGGQITRRVSVSASGTQGDSESGRRAAISADGRYVVFDSFASNLVQGDTGDRQEIFVKDRLTGLVLRASVSSAGVGGNGASVVPTMSADGRYVAFRSQASNLVAGDTNNDTDCFVHDLHTRSTTRVSVATGGTEGHLLPFDPESSELTMPSLSADGRYVAFLSGMTDLVAGDTNEAADVFVHDRVAGATVRVSVSSTGVESDDDCRAPVISADGRFVLFGSWANNLVAGDANVWCDMFVHDRDKDEDGIFDETHAGARETVLVSRGDSGQWGNNDTYSGVMTPDASQFYLNSFASNLVSGDTNADVDVFRVNVGPAPATVRVSLDWQGNQILWGASSGAVSGSGRFLALESIDNHVVPGVRPPASYDSVTYVRDLITGTVYHVSPPVVAPLLQTGSRSASLSRDGRTVVFQSDSESLVPGDTNLVGDVFIRTIGPDGRADWELLPVSIQNTQTSMLDNTLGDPVIAHGSELDAAYAEVNGNNLHLTLAGNFDFANARLHVFLDSAGGGQNRIRQNSSTAGSLAQMGDDGSGNGLRFDIGFDADYYLCVRQGEAVDFATLSSDGTIVGRYLGALARDGAGVLTGGSNPDNILGTLDNSNTAGVTAGTGASSGSGVRTGVEFVIPLASIGSPQCGIRVSAFLADAATASVSNQVLGPVGGRAALGPARALNLAVIPREQSFSASPGLSAYANLATPISQDQSQYGRGIAVKSGRMLVGARRLDRPGANDSGGVFSSEKTSGTWSAPVQLTPTTLPAAGDRLGHAIAMDQGWAFVGAPNRDSAGADAGAVWVFERTGPNQWTQRAILTAPDAQAGATFGYSVDLAFDRAIVGAPGHDGVGTDSGKAYVYQRNGSTWALVGQLAPPELAAGDQFGFDVGVSLLGTEVLVGAPGDDRPGLTDAGAAYLFRRSGSLWPNTVQRRFDAEASSVSNERVGTSVALANSFAAVGAPDLGTGAVYTFAKGNSSWSVVTSSRLVPPAGETGDLFGFSLAASNSLLVVGAPNSGRPFFDAGLLYTYNFSSGSFGLGSQLFAPDASAGDALGGDVAVDGLTLAAGAGGYDIGGTAYAFDLSLADPVVLSSPPDAEVEEGPVTLDWAVSSPQAGVARVLRDGLEVSNQPFSAGSSNPSFTFTAQPATVGTFVLSVQTACGAAQSEPTVITLQPLPACPADYDNSGGVDGDDVIAFFGDWDNGLIAADFDDSGGVDGDDVIAFFERWDQGC